MHEENKRQKFSFIAILLFLLLSYPILSVANKVAFWFGLPSLYVYLFLVWAVAIFLLFFNAETKHEVKRKKNNE
ncbi:MAG: hypothetical protein QM725_15805 [Lacibacter sp.]